MTTVPPCRSRAGSTHYPLIATLGTVSAMNAGGETVLGAPAGEGGEAVAMSVARLLEGAGLGVCWVVPHREREEMLMRKLVINSIINPLTVPLVCPPPPRRWDPFSLLPALPRSASRPIIRLKA